MVVGQARQRSRHPQTSVRRVTSRHPPANSPVHRPSQAHHRLSHHRLQRFPAVPFSPCLQARSPVPRRPTIGAFTLGDPLTIVTGSVATGVQLRSTTTSMQRLRLTWIGIPEAARRRRSLHMIAQGVPPLPATAIAARPFLLGRHNLQTQPSPLVAALAPTTSITKNIISIGRQGCGNTPVHRPCWPTIKPRRSWAEAQGPSGAADLDPTRLGASPTPSSSSPTGTTPSGITSLTHQRFHTAQPPVARSVRHPHPSVPHHPQLSVRHQVHPPVLTTTRPSSIASETAPVPTAPADVVPLTWEHRRREASRRQTAATTWPQATGSRSR